MKTDKEPPMSMRHDADDMLDLDETDDSEFSLTWSYRMMGTLMFVCVLGFGLYHLWAEINLQNRMSSDMPMIGYGISGIAILGSIWGIWAFRAWDTRANFND